MTTNHTGTSITLAYQTYRQMERELEELRAKAAVQQQPIAAADLDEYVLDLQSEITAAISVAQFAVGNLNPESVRGWPHEQLKEFGELLIKTAMGTDQDQIMLGLSFVHFARECADVATFRANRTRAAKEVVGVPEVAPADPPFEAESDVDSPDG